jgi:hypothetical protein
MHFPGFSTAGCRFPGTVAKAVSLSSSMHVASTDDNRDCKSICYFLIIQLGREKITATKSIQKIILRRDEERKIITF